MTTLHHGDCITIMREMPEASIDAIITDPPYNLSFMSKPWDAFEGQEDAGFAYWLSGLIDGEGHFSIKAHTRGTHAPAFTLKLRADERGTLETVKRKIGIGSITDEPKDPHPLVKWTVQDKAGCQRLVDLLDKYPLRAKKLADYWTWRDAVCEWTSRPRGNRWAGAADNSRMAELRKRLMEGRAYNEIPWSGNEFQDWSRLWVAEALRVLKPGGHLLAFGGTRTWHRLAVAVEDAGFEIRDSIAWMYGSGFPKSLDVGKAIDKAAGAEREVIGRASGARNGNGQNIDYGSFGSAADGTYAVTAPATAEAAKWQGWGTALKPAHEPIVVARKPLQGTVAANVLAHGTGALNIDATRIASTDNTSRPPGRQDQPGWGLSSRTEPSKNHDAGRWPANVVLDEDQAAALDAQSGNRKASGVYAGDGSRNPGHHSTDFGGKNRPASMYGDQGGASRFFYVARKDDECDPASTAESSSSQPSEPAGSAPSGAATSVRLDTARLTDSPSTSDTASESSTSAPSGTPVTPTTDERFSLPTLDRASGAATNAPTDITTTTTSRSRFDGFADHVTSNGTLPNSELGDLGSRFKYCAKAPKNERPVVDGVSHPTVKPLSLMRYLVRLVTPPGGTVLDMFAGSGTTLEAARLEGFDVVGIEREAEYLPLIRARLDRAEQQPANEPDQDVLDFGDSA